MSILYVGGVKSGKSRIAEAKVLSLHTNPVYLATTELFDNELNERIAKHKAMRSESFRVIEAPLDLVTALKFEPTVVLVECITMWINNMLYYEYTKEMVIEAVEALLALPHTFVFVLNEVGAGIIGASELERDFVDLSGIVGQILARHCDEVYHVVVGIERRIK